MKHITGGPNDLPKPSTGARMRRAVMSQDFSIRNLEPKCEYSFSCACSCSWSCEILTKSPQPPQNLHRPLKTFAYVSLRYSKHCGNSGSGLW